MYEGLRRSLIVLKAIMAIDCVSSSIFRIPGTIIPPPRCKGLCSLTCIWIVLLLISHTQERFIGVVIDVSDGDTIKVLREFQQVKIRIYGIDAPEKSQPFGRQARQFVAMCVLQKSVTIITHDTDRYGRIVADVLLNDGRSLARELVHAGLAWWFRRYAPLDAVLQNLEHSAREARRGLWSADCPIPPWFWRRGVRSRSFECL